MSRHAHRRRAMTLIEVLATTVLLAILSSVCASLLRSVPVTMAHQSGDMAAIDLLALERLADELITEDDFLARLTTDSSADMIVGWPGEPARPPVRIRRVELGASGDEPTRAWVAFSCGELIVWRFIDLPEEMPSP